MSVPSATRIPPSKPGKRGTAAVDAQIYQSVFSAVMSQRLRPGTRLPEARLCELFGVSRTIVRKALQRLAHDHIVELRVNKGAVVASPTPEETREIFVARRAIEAAIMPLAVARATPADIARLRQMLADEHAALDGHVHHEWVKLASGFHMTLATIAGNPILTGFLTELVSRCSLIVALYEVPGESSCEHDEHSLIVDLIAAGDALGAVACMTEHLEALERRLQPQQAAAEPDLASLLGMD
jgi:DNA-binding GntR family transcriptional regulator